MYIYIYIYTRDLAASVTTVTEVFPCFFLSCKANAREKPAKTEHGPHSSCFLCCSMYRVSINSFPDYKHLLQENYVEYKRNFCSKCNSTQEVILRHISTFRHVLLFVFHGVFL